MASLAIMLSYITSINLGDFDSDPFAQPIWVLIVEYGVICVALLIDLFIRQKTNTVQSVGDKNNIQ